MTSSTISRISVGRAELLSRSAKATDALSMFAEASTQLRRLMPYDAAVWRVTDPVTGMMTAPIRAENLDEGGCAVYWESELFTENVNLFRDLAQAAVPVAGLRQTTNDLPARSTLYQTFMRPRGLQDELRAVLRVGGRPQGHISLFRAEGRAAFDDAETQLIASVLTPLAKQLRSFAEPSAQPLPDAPYGPGLLLFDASGALMSVNDDALAYLDTLPEGPAVPSPQGLRVPAWVQATAMKARAVAQERDRGQARARVRNRAGRWLVCHASCLREANGGLGASAVVIEPAKTSEIVPLIVDAYELTDRETEVTQYIARGLPTGEIAAQLHLSPHTVRDHIKAVFEKVGVSSRGELVGKLFTEYYAPLAEKNMTRVHTG
ncbi:LuxR family transcriptional regulator [Streptomyces sp. CB00316]|uniref:helix-turn-helix domain-containing protein n=1 Tax=unclassified Streptomyces TaxID=2593676 RepID=UPI00093C26CB|nr:MULTISPECIES: helix-turn-helix transcriptional regulator [unclassified Streptomyces]MBT2379551.1 helix-turn-helix transcriptional regulator [Streptomyces sp. ISL-111]MBT2428559.1 helix-turn-helix transcriptional regulator [Streptomyces sp. ISL-112]MBT2465422.1 helix-turn-helix transcriptional regulator [Streptomyces sp. ISL-63]OKJ19213.1 LuxR family transcriptional regulator [Streptomyces sp. CB00316]